MRPRLSLSLSSASPCMQQRNFHLVALGVLVLGAIEARGTEPLFRLDLAGRTLEGTPLALTDDKVILLTRDGGLAEFAPQEASNYSRLPGSFHSYSQAEIRGQLLREFGQGFEVSGVGHYLVVHPTGKRDQWAPRFE